MLTEKSIRQNISYMMLRSRNCLSLESKSYHPRKNCKNRFRNLRTNCQRFRKSTYNFRQISGPYTLYKVIFLLCFTIQTFSQTYPLAIQNNQFSQKIRGYHNLFFKYDILSFILSLVSSLHQLNPFLLIIFSRFLIKFFLVLFQPIMNGFLFLSSRFI